MEDDGTASLPDVHMEDVGHEKASASAGKQSYKSWKKKYRKMRVKFEEKMRHGEEMHRLEQKAIETNKRLAVEIDRLLDYLLDMNNSVQMPPDKRFDLSLGLPSPPSSVSRADDMVLPIDDPHHSGYNGERPSKSLRDLIEKVPHHGFATAAELFPDVVADLETGSDGPAVDPALWGHPASFLTADDVDNYLWDVDQRINAQRRARGLEPMPNLPTLAPKAAAAAALHPEGTATNGSGSGAGAGSGSGAATNGVKGDAAAAAAASALSATSRDFALRNPTSVYNWLRKHAPRTFLQDVEPAGSAAADRENGDDSHHDDHDGHGHGHGHGHGGGRRGAHGKAAGAAASRSRRSVGGATPAEKGSHRAPTGGGRSASKRGGGSGATVTPSHPRSKRTAAASASKAAAAAAAAAAMAAAAGTDVDDGMDYYDTEAAPEPSAAAATPTPAAHPASAAAAKGGSKRKRTVDDDPGYRPKGGSSRPTKKKRKSEGGEGTASSATAAATTTKKSRRSEPVLLAPAAAAVDEDDAHGDDADAD